MTLTRIILKTIVTILVALDAAGSWAAAENVLFVSPHGSDAWSGRLAARAKDGSDGPLASLRKAVEQSRQRAAGQPRPIVLLDSREELLLR
jgi:hypothetical protein